MGLNEDSSSPGKLEDLLKGTNVQYDVVLELVKGLIGDKTYREKYSYAYEGIEFLDSYNLEKESHATPRLIHDVETIINGSFDIKPKGFLKKPVLSMSYFRAGSPQWTLKYDNANEPFVQNLGKVIIRYLSHKQAEQAK